MNEGQILKLFIKGKGLTVEEAANKVGKSRATLQAYFKQSSIEEDTKIVLTNKLGVTFKGDNTSEAEVVTLSTVKAQNVEMESLKVKYVKALEQISELQFENRELLKKLNGLQKVGKANH